MLALGGVGIITFNPFEVDSDPAGDPSQLLTATAESAATPLPARTPTPIPSPTTLPTPNLKAAPQPPDQERFMTDLSRAAVLMGEIDDPESLLVVVNKQRPFRDKSYAPELRAVLGSDHELRPDAAEALEQMLAAAADDGVDFQVLSAYRSYERQKASRVNAARKASADRVDELSARPGFSEHQSGLAVDLGMIDGKCELKECFAETAGGQWLHENATEFGFIERYPTGQRDVTGYVYEPWHLRFIGVEAAADMLQSGAPTFEEFFGLAPAPDY